MPLPDGTSVDTSAERSVSFAPPTSGPGEDAGSTAYTSIAVGPGRPAMVPPSLVARDERGELNAYPIQPTKVQRPPLREETLARGRLLDWLQIKVHHRVVFVVAEAGYGKTTLLADFSRRTRLRTLWYRLDEEDRNWISFLNHLVAAGREHDPSFAEGTARLLRDIDGNGATRQSVTKAFVRDFQTLGVGGAALILDDYHVVDDAPDISYIVGELIAHAPERVTFVFSTRREPSVRVARLRALGELAELSTDDLRFSEPETEQLFRETYHQPLEPDVLGDLSRGTEGWAASLQLVQVAIRDRSAGDVRRFVRTLSGAEGHLYDYLAEEVVGDLPEDLQEFLMKTSLLEDVTQELAAFAVGIDGAESQRLLGDAERLGLLAVRGGSRTARRYHPLVRQFLQQRLRRDSGPRAVADVHVRVAEGCDGIDWATSCFHYAAAGRRADVQRVVRTAVSTIMGSGQFHAAAKYLDEWAAGHGDAAFEVIRSRADYRAGKTKTALDRAELALAVEPESDLAATNAISLRLLTGNIEEANDLATSLASSGHDPLLRSIAEATAAMMRLAVDGNLSVFVSTVLAMASNQRALGLAHYEGVSLVNVAAALKPQGRAQEALEHASTAIDLLSGTSDGDEALAGRLCRSWALAHLGRWSAALSEMRDLQKGLSESSRVEALVEIAAIHLWYGDRRDAIRLLGDAQPMLELRPDLDELWRVLSLEVELQSRNLGKAREKAAVLRRGILQLTPGLNAHALAADAYLAVADGAKDAGELVARAAALANRQDATLWSRYCAILAAAAGDDLDYSERLRDAVEDDHAYLSILAELVVDGLHRTDVGLVDAIRAEALERPARWLASLRTTVDDPESRSRWAAADLLDTVGEAEDVLRLRSLAKSRKGPDAIRSVGRRLARRLAPRVFVEDQGAVTIKIGTQVVAGTQIRRKVLALLCFLLSRPDFAATRDQVLDALWPDLDPLVGLNSLNQTVYFLRRVFEPEYQEETSPGYVRHDSSILSLDTELVRGRSAECWERIARASASGAPADVASVAGHYKGKFALDFSYEEWSTDYRDSLHAAYLQVVEHAVSADTNASEFGRAIGLARGALEIDPTAEDLEKALLRLYRLSGAHSAAAEQYGHYAGALRRDLDLEPPPLDTI
ncbi:MAG: BTAD domain-containing putative transcriptional regulator [Chloroflexota bacterium]